MHRRLAILALSCGLVGVALGAGWGVRHCGASGIGPVSLEVMRLPKESRFVMGLDVRRFVAGEFYARFAGPSAPARPQAFNELALKAGIVPERDLDRVLYAGGLGTDGRRGLLLAMGRFDEERIAGALAERHPEATVRAIGQRRLHVLSGPPRATALALITPGMLAIGPAEHVERLLTDEASRLSANPRMGELLRRVSGTPTFWMVGDGSVLEMANRGAPGSGPGGGIPLGLPPIESVEITSDLDPDVVFSVIAHTADEAGARALGETLKGFLALATLQAHQKPELKQLPSAVQVEQQGTRVRLSGTVSHDLLGALLPRSGPPAAAPADAAPTP